MAGARAYFNWCPLTLGVHDCFHPGDPRVEGDPLDFTRFEEEPGERETTGAFRVGLGARGTYKALNAALMLSTVSTGPPT